MKRPFLFVLKAQNRQRQRPKLSCSIPIINFTDEDFICGEAKINESCEDGAEDTDEEEANEDECCSDCPYFCPVCGECMCEDECNE